MSDTTQYKPVPECRTVAELLEDPARWTRGVFAKTPEGYACNSDCPEAACWCLSGAINRVHGGSEARYYESHKKLKAALGLGLSCDITYWNDDVNRTHAEVLDAVRRAGI